MKLIVGLGNTGKHYEKTRHNLGFMVVDALARTFDAPFKQESKLSSEVSKLETSNSKLLLAKPTTMMNLSGNSVQALVQYYKIDVNDVWVVYDEADLLFGQLRVRKGGVSAGHNGIKSIIQQIGDDFWRIRVGIKNEFFENTATDKFVLDPFTSTEKPLVPKIVAESAGYLESALQNGLDDHTHQLI